MDWKKFVNDNIMELKSEAEAPATSAPSPAIAPVPSGIPGLRGIGVVSVAAPQPVQLPPWEHTPITTSVESADPALASGFIEKLKSKYSSSPLYPVVEQFTNFLDSLQEFIPDEASRFRAALKQLQKSGVIQTAARLNEAYLSLITVLEGETSRFETVIQQQRNREIGVREATVKSISAQIEAKNNEIKALMEQRDTVVGEVLSNRTKLDTVANSFDGARQTLRSQLEDSMRKIGLYLPVATK